MTTAHVLNISTTSKKCILTSTFRISIAILFLPFLTSPAIAQHNSKESFYFESHAGVLSSFGPTESQAEITGGIDTLYYDQKKHFIPGFTSAFTAELTAGYQKNKARFQSTIGYFKQDFRLIQKYSPEEYPYVLAKMLSVRASVMLGLSNYEKRGPYGFYTGISFCLVFPIAYEMNDQTKATFEFDDFQPAAQLSWTLDLSYSIALGKSGLYTLAGFYLVIPGLVGCVGKMNMQSNPTHNLVHDKIKMYSYTAFLGFGYRLGK
jgi:hypothetical protein